MWRLSFFDVGFPFLRAVISRTVKNKDDLKMLFESVLILFYTGMWKKALSFIFSHQTSNEYCLCLFCKPVNVWIVINILNDPFGQRLIFTTQNITKYKSHLIKCVKSKKRNNTYFFNWTSRFTEKCLHSLENEVLIMVIYLFNFTIIVTNNQIRFKKETKKVTINLPTYTQTRSSTEHFAAPI